MTETPLSSSTPSSPSPRPSGSSASTQDGGRTPIPSMTLADAEALVEEAYEMTNGPEDINGRGLTSEDGMIAALKDGQTIAYHPGTGWEVGVRETPCTSHLREYMKPRKRSLWDRLRGR